MRPDKSFVTITGNQAKIVQFIQELIIAPRAVLRQWALVTNQTPAAKIGYIGQHLASLITGIQGTGSGARGDDLADKSEVKSCNKIDQVDKCKDCGARVMRLEKVCSKCGSDRIDRKNDSKWLFSVRSQDELDQYLNMKRIVLILMDYPRFDLNDFRNIRICAFEIYPCEKRMGVFAELIKYHYKYIYRPKADRGDKTNPMNLHPWSFQFYKCNPIKTFECIIKNVDTPHPVIKMMDFIDPLVERNSSMRSVMMPSQLLHDDEWDVLLETADFSKVVPLLTDSTLTKEALMKLSKKKKVEALPELNEELRNLIPLREIVSNKQSKQYHRT